jgi:hypothetical protein
MKVKILIPTLIFIMVSISCNKTETINPTNNQFDKQNKNVNVIRNDISDNNQLLPDRGAELACIKTDPQTGAYICDGLLCRRDLNGPCKVHPCQCVNFKNPGRPLPKNVIETVFETKDELEAYKKTLLQHEK